MNKKKRFREDLELLDKLYSKKRPEMRIELVDGKIEYEIVPADRLYPEDILITDDMVDELLKTQLLKKWELKDDVAYMKVRPEMIIIFVDRKIEYLIWPANGILPTDILLTNDMIDDLLDERRKYQIEFHEWFSHKLSAEERKKELESVK